MKHILFKENPNNKYNIVVLIKDSAMKENELRINYVNPLLSQGIEEDTIIAFNLKLNDAGKSPVKFIKSYLITLLQALEQLGTTHILVTDSNYFKVLTNSRKSDPHYGYALPCTIKGYEHMNIVLSVNYQALFYKPDLQDKLTLSLDTLATTVSGTNVVLGSGIIHSESYPDTVQDIRTALQKLHKHPTLTCDIETFDLKFYKAGIGTIAFAWDQHNGVAFACDYRKLRYLLGGGRINNLEVKDLLKEFFETYTGTLIFHNANFDSKILIYELWMDNLQDSEGMLKGIATMSRAFEDTKIIAYLATNSCAGNDLKLKSLAHKFAGNYAQDNIKNIKDIKLPDLLRYNLIDCLSTWYVYNNYYPKMVEDNQLDIYRTIKLPSVKLLLFTELNGMPIDMDEVQNTKRLFTQLQIAENIFIQESPLAIEFTKTLQREEMLKKNLLLKVKVKPIEDFLDIKFNPGSGLQLQKLLHEELGLEVTDTTDTGQPATGNKILKKHMFNLMNEFNITEDELL